MGGTNVQTAPPPSPPSASQSMQDYVQNLPQLYETQMKYLPKFAELSKGIAEQTYPTTAGLQESLAGQAAAGITAEVPDWMRDEYKSNVSAQLGENAGSRIGADYVSRGLMKQKMDYQNYYRQMGLALAGRQQIVQPPSFQTSMGGYSPSSVMGFNASTYGPYASAMGQTNMANAQIANQPSAFGQLAGAGLQTAGTLAGASIIASSSIVLKDNVEKIDNALEVVEKLEGVTYNWKENAMTDGGVIAESVENVIPEAVVDVDGIKHIKPMMIIGYLIEAVKELSRNQKGVSNG